MRRVLIQPKGRRDLLDIYRNLGETLGNPKAEQFQSNTIQTFFDLAQMPNIGVPRKFGRNPQKDLRMWRVRDFEEYLIFYFVEPDFVQVERVVHAKRDYRRQV